MQFFTKVVLMTVFIAGGLVRALTPANADTTVTVDPLASWIGYMNVSELPANGGAFLFGGPWATPDLVATFTGPVLTLLPNATNDPSSFWFTPSGGPGALGNKNMDANMYVETTGLYNGQTLTFTGNVLSNTLSDIVNPNGESWTSLAFIRDYSADYSSYVSITKPLVNGVFSISLATINDPSRHIWYGFETIGPDVWITDDAAYGSVQVIAVPEPPTSALIGLGLAFTAFLLRRRQPSRGRRSKPN